MHILTDRLARAVLPMLASLAIALAICVAPMAPAQAADAVPTARPALLTALEGKWTMRGDVRGKPVTYAMQAQPTLQGKFVELHMRDVQVPAQYEARVFIGVDAATGAVITHWMDNHGAENSIPHATGQIVGDTLQFTFAYKHAPFRNTFTYNRAAGSWVFVLESQQPDGSWKHFARYQVEKAGA